MDEKQFIRPEAGTATVESLVNSVRRGQVRIPSFQRPLRWESADVTALFDSMYKGYPIGSLLLQKKDADAAEVFIGPLRVAAPVVHGALWVIDGQQRLTSLAAGLARPTPVPTTPDDAYVVYFDARTKSFAAPPRNGVLPSTWVPVAQLLDASGLMEWIFNWQHGHDPLLRSAVIEVGTRIRQYQVPLYTIATEDEEVLRDIFYRTNAFGKAMKWADVHKALFSKQGEYPSTLDELADELATKGMGRPTEEQLLTCVMAAEGLDPTRNLVEHSRRGGEKDLDKLQHSVHDSLPVLSQVLDFLRNEAEIPHLRLLPRALPLPILTRYFRLFPRPSRRSRQLLVRWTWRVLLGTSLYDERTLLRHGVTSLQAGKDEHQAQVLLRLVPHELPVQFQYKLPEKFDARTAESRLALWGMYTQQPLMPDWQPVNLAELLYEREQAGLRTIISTSGLSMRENPVAFSPANRVLFPNGHVRQMLLESDWQTDKTFLTSHLIAEATLKCLKQGDKREFLRLRGQAIEQVVRAESTRLAAWGQSDRISISQIAAEVARLSEED